MTQPPVIVDDIMRTEVVTLGRNDTLDLANDILQLGRIRHLPIVEDGRLVGVISQRDLFRSALSRALGYGTKAEQAMLKTLLVKEVMTDEVVTIPPGTSIKEAVRLMIEKKIGCLPVVQDGRLVGLITETDLLRCLL
jgi:CBS domain-containing protein